MKRILIIDTETNGLDPAVNEVVEVGCVLWNVDFRQMEEVYSALLPAKSNEAEHVNGIPAGMLPRDSMAWEVVDELADVADAYVAHNAPFDASFCRGKLKTEKPWICTIEDFEWPIPSAKKGLVDIALAHGVGIVAAHRAINDCLTLARMLERLPDVADRLAVALAKATRPKGFVVSLAPFQQKDVVKAAGFHWEPAQKKWWRIMAIEDAKKLPFETTIRPL